MIPFPRYPENENHSTSDALEHGCYTRLYSFRSLLIIARPEATCKMTRRLDRCPDLLSACHWVLTSLLVYGPVFNDLCTTMAYIMTNRKLQLDPNKLHPDILYHQQSFEKSPYPSTWEWVHDRSGSLVWCIMDLGSQLKPLLFFFSSAKDADLDRPEMDR